MKHSKHTEIDYARIILAIAALVAAIQLGSSSPAPNRLREAAVFTYRMIFEDGKPTDPPSFTTAVPTWRVGDKVLIRPGVELEILAIEDREDGAVWTVRRR